MHFFDFVIFYFILMCALCFYLFEVILTDYFAALSLRPSLHLSRPLIYLHHTQVHPHNLSSRYSQLILSVIPSIHSLP